MKLSYLNFWTAVISLLASLVWFAIGDGLSGLIWFVFSLVWLVRAVARLRSPDHEPRPGGRLARRFWRMLLWG